MGSCEEGIRQAREASEISEQLDDAVETTRCLIELVWSFHHDKDLDAAEKIASRSAINLLPEEGEQLQVYQCHYLLGNIYRSKGETMKAIKHLEIALGIASSFNWLNLQFWIQYWMAALFSDEGRFDDAHAYVEHAKLHTANDHDTYLLGRAMKPQARFWHRQNRLEEAKSEALRVVDTFEKFGATNDAEDARVLLRWINRDARSSGSGSCCVQ